MINGNGNERGRNARNGIVAPTIPTRAFVVLCAGLALVEVSAQEHRHAATPATENASAAQLYNAQDLLFLVHMIMHHEQALELADLVASRSERDEFIRFARYLHGAQRAEIEQMRSLLQVAAARGMQAPHHEMDGDPPMHGMLSKAQMSAITAASGEEFERSWLEGMILHHQGALDMARAQQRQQFENGRRPFGLDVLVDDMLVVQRAEITKMRAWLEAWGRAVP